MREKSGCRRGKSSASLSRREDAAAGSNALLLMTVRYLWSCCDAVLRQVARRAHDVKRCLRDTGLFEVQLSLVDHGS